MNYSNLKRGKSGYPKIRTPIMLCLKAIGIHTAPPGNSYNFDKNLGYLNIVV